MSFLDSAFPAVINTTDFDLVMYNRIVNGITALTAEMITHSDQTGNVTLAAAKAIEFGSVSKLTWSTPNVQVDSLEVASPWTIATLEPAGDCTVSNNATVDAGGTLTLSGDLSVMGIIDVDTITDSAFTIAQIAEPDDPPNGQWLLWLSNGTGVGDVGDIMIKAQVGGVVKSKTLVDFV